MRGMGLFLGCGKQRVISAPVALTPGPELWPQPAFNASTGLTLVRCSVTGGQLVGNGAEVVASATATMVAGTINVGDQFQYSYDVASASNNGTVTLSIGGVLVPGHSAPGTYSGTYTAASVLNQDIITRLSDNIAGDKADNVSVKKLS